MGKIASQALYDMGLALDGEQHGATINLVPEHCSITEGATSDIAVLHLPIYNKNANLHIRFLMDTMGFLIKVSVFESGVPQALTYKEESMLFDAFDWLYNRSYIANV